MLHFPRWYGTERAKGSLELFAGEVMPRVRPAINLAQEPRNARELPDACVQLGRAGLRWLRLW